MPSKVTVIVADDHKLFRSGFAGILEDMQEIENVLLAENGKVVMEILDKEMVDIVFMDITMPKLDGCQTTKLIKAKFPKVKVIALSMHKDRHSVLEIIALGAKGYLTKNTDEDEIKEAISTVLSGKLYFTPEVANSLLNGIYTNEIDFSQLKKLGIISSTEKQLLKLLSEGLTSEKIGEILCISSKTVESHKTTLFRKTGTTNVASLVSYSFRHKLIE